MRVTTGAAKRMGVSALLSAAFLCAHLARVMAYAGEPGDGVIQFTEVRTDGLAWEPEAGFDSLNLYRGTWPPCGRLGFTPRIRLRCRAPAASAT
jgi:hypothetical protein